MLPLTDGFLKMMNFKYVFRWHLPVLFLILFSLRAAAADTLLVLGDSLSAGYRMAGTAAWPALLNDKWQPKTTVVNASISGDTTSGGRSRLAALLAQHQPSHVVIELGGNDALRGLAPAQVRGNLEKMVVLAGDAGAKVLLLGIDVPPNYGPAYRQRLRQVYADLARQHGVALVPFFLEGVALQPGLMQSDGLHPTAAAQPRLLENAWPLLEPLL